MMVVLKNILYAIKSKKVGNSIQSIVDVFVDLLLKDADPAMKVVIDMTKHIKNLILSIPDEIFFECFETFLMNAYCYNALTGNCESTNLQALSAALAEASPNPESDYEGNDEKLKEYAKRIVKLIYDCGTKQKAYYLACTTRALLSGQIDTNKFFKLCRCIQNLTEEDLEFLSKNISEGNISRSEDYIDDYRALGLLYETDDGFAYSRRAFELKKYSLCYESQVAIPDNFPDRHAPISSQYVEEAIDPVNDSVAALAENLQWKEGLSD